MNKEEEKKSTIEKLTDFAHKNPFCFMVGAVVVGEALNNTYKFVLGLCGKNKKS